METEKQPPQKFWIDQLDTSEALKVMLDNHNQSILAIKNALPEIEVVVEKIVRKLNKSLTSRIIYTGAGTSGRIGVQDAIELYPTFGWDRVGYIIAGGDKALTKSIEDAEDNIENAKKEIKKLKINKDDIVIGIAASGYTPFTIQVIKEAKKLGSLTIGIGNNFNAKLQKTADLGINLLTGYEILAGSTRLKAGTSQKIVLNLISTLCMAKLKRVRNGLMSHLVVTNNKLKKRKKYISKINII